jgi:hypothetical protein
VTFLLAVKAIGSFVCEGRTGVAARLNRNARENMMDLR